MLKIIVVDTDLTAPDSPYQEQVMVAAFPEGRTLADLHAWLAVKPRKERTDKGKPRKAE